MLAVVTGGTGFLGRYCIVALVQAGWRVRVLARRPTAHPMLAGVPFDTVPGDLADTAALARLVAGADAVVHGAGLVAARDAAAFDAVNRDGTARLAQAVAARSPLGGRERCRFVLVSSMAARIPSLSAYAASKRAGEAAAVAALGQPACTIVRPGVIYGPWDMAGLALLRLARGPLVPVPGPPALRLAMIHARDAAEAIAALCAGGVGGVYELADATTRGHRWQEIVQSVRAGRSARFVQVPDLAFHTAAAASEGWGRLTGRPALFGRGKAREILHRDWGSAPEWQPPAALWLPRITLDAGMRETLDWRRASGTP